MRHLSKKLFQKGKFSLFLISILSPTAAIAQNCSSSVSAQEVLNFASAFQNQVSFLKENQNPNQGDCAINGVTFTAIGGGDHPTNCTFTIFSRPLRGGWRIISISTQTINTSVPTGFNASGYTSFSLRASPTRNETVYLLKVNFRKSGETCPQDGWKSAFDPALR